MPRVAASLLLAHVLALWSSGCAPSPPTIEPRALVVPSAGADEPARTPARCEIPQWDAPRGTLAEVPSVPSPLVTHACEQVSARARAVLRAPFPRDWQEAHDDAVEARRELEERGSDEYAFDPVEAVDDLRSVVGTCVPAGAGAWVLEPMEEGFDGFAYTIHVRVLHVDTDGTVRTGPTLTLGAGDEASGHVELRPVFDFDGDARIEATVDAGYTGNAQLFTATSEGVREVSLPLEIGTPRWIDYDADGRPDLLADGVYSESECYERSNEWGMPSLLVHAGEGLGFSADDSVARRYAADVCPCAPTRLLARPLHAEDHPLFSGQTRVLIACARLWGVSASGVALRLASEIDEIPPEDRHEGDVCAASLESLSAFAEAEPPLRLDR